MMKLETYIKTKDKRKKIKLSKALKVTLRFSINMQINTENPHVK